MNLTENWRAIAAASDFVCRTDQLAALGFSARAQSRKVVAGHWRRLLPGICLLTNGVPTRRQLMRASLLWAGDCAVVDGHDSCAFHGLRSPGWRDTLVHVAVPLSSRVRSLDFVRVRRTAQTFATIATQHVRYLLAPDAVIQAGRQLTTHQALALFSDALLQRVVSLHDLHEAFARAPERGRSGTKSALEAVSGGARSVPESRIRDLARGNRLLGEVLFNPRLRLQTGRIVVPDLLVLSSAVVHEVNGRRWHAGEDRFESMQERHDAMTVAGLTLLHNSPRRIAAAPATVMAEIEQTHRIYVGRGLPLGIRLSPERATASGGR